MILSIPRKHVFGIIREALAVQKGMQKGRWEKVLGKHNPHIIPNSSHSRLNQ